MTRPDWSMETAAGLLKTAREYEARASWYLAPVERTKAEWMVREHICDALAEVRAAEVYHARAAVLLVSALGGAL